MTQTLVPIVPESAPFSPPQRAWLNGFFAGVFSIDATSASALNNGLTGLPPSGSAAVGGTSNGMTTAEPEDFPWHDPTLPIVERMQLAEGKPIERRLMAAMAQLDCGACGHLCQTYAEAIATGTEADLTKCVPGGRDTAKKLRELIALSKSTSGSNGKSSISNGVAIIKATLTSDDTTHSNAGPSQYNRTNPFIARVKSVDRLNKDGSEKDIRHVVVDMLDSGLTYEPGDAVGVYPVNCRELVDEVLERLGWDGSAQLRDTTDDHASTNHELQSPSEVAAKTIRSRLLQDYSLSKVNEELLELIASRATNPDEAQQLRALAEQDDGAFVDSADLVDVLHACPSSRPTAVELLPLLSTLQPRLYSISSSLRMHPAEVHLTIGVVRYQHGQRKRKGVCSTFFADRVQAGDEVRVFIQASHGFRLPPQPGVPIIMVGPGTGIAPFRAFLEERKASLQNVAASSGERSDGENSCGESWLIFGDQRMSTDFLYEQELLEYQRCNVLTRLSTAFSRDQAEKIYVQTKMQEQGAELWNWLQRGAYFYVCGDAKRMAPDVDAALQAIIVAHGGRSPADAKAYLQAMRQAKRYQRDVY